MIFLMKIFLVVQKTESTNCTKGKTEKRIKKVLPRELKRFE